MKALKLLRAQRHAHRAVVKIAECSRLRDIDENLRELGRQRVVGEITEGEFRRRRESILRPIIHRNVLG